MSYRDTYGDNIITLKNAKIIQKNFTVLSNVNLNIKRGRFTYLIGKTGSGKSSLLKVLYGHLPLSEGQGEVVGFDLLKLKTSHIPDLRRKLGIVFQDFQLLTDRSVEKNLLFVLEATGWNNKTLIEDRINEVLSSVDPETSNDIMTLLKQVSQERNCAVLMATHDYHLIQNFPGEAIKCEDGAISMIEDTNELFV